MALGIVKVIITPMQRMIVEISPADIEPNYYRATLEAEGEDAFSESFDGVRWRSPGLKAPKTYTLTVTAVYDDPEDNADVTQDVTIQRHFSMATMLRQAVWDILFDGQIETVDGRQLYSLHDKYFRPVVLRAGETLASTLPAVEVGMPVLRQTAFQSDVRRREEWRIPVRLLDGMNPDNSDEYAGMWRLAEQVQAAVDQTANLNLGGRGVHDKAWSWRVMEDADTSRDRMGGLKLWLTVLVERPIGAIG